MKRTAFILILSILPIFYYVWVLTQGENLPRSKEFFLIDRSPPMGWALDLRALLSARPENVAANSILLTIQDLDRIYELKLDRGIRNLPVLSALLIREAGRARKKGDHKRSVELATYSVKFSSDLSHPYFELAKARWRQNPFYLHHVIPEVIHGFSAELRYYPSSLRIFYNAFYIVANAMFMTFILFGAVLLIKYLPLYFYDIQKNLSQEISRLLINSLKIFVLFIPLFLRLNLLWAILYWCVLLWGYVSKRERQLLFIFFLALLYLPFLLRSSSSILDNPTSDIVLEMHRANYENWNDATEEKLRNWLSIQPNDPDVLFTAGLIEKRLGRYEEAEQFYQRSVSCDPRFSEAHANLGNVYLALKEPQLAIDSYQKALALDGEKASYYYNLYRAYSQETFLSGKIDEAFQKARHLNPKLIDFYSAIDQASTVPSMNRLVIDEAVSTRRLWKRFIAELVGREGWLFLLFRAWFEKIPSRINMLTPVLFLGFIIGMSRYARAKRFLTRCPMCGSPTHRFYLGASEQEFICFNCYRIFVQKEKLHPKIMEKKSLQAKEFQRQGDLISRGLSYVFAGYGYLWKGYLVRGVLLLFIFFIFILKFFHWNGVVNSAFVPSSPSVWKFVFWGGLFALFYGLVLQRIYRLKPKVGDRPRMA